MDPPSSPRRRWVIVPAAIVGGLVMLAVAAGALTPDPEAPVAAADLPDAAPGGTEAGSDLDESAEPRRSLTTTTTSPPTTTSTNRVTTTTIAGTTTALVVAVIDGDTIEVELPDGTIDQVRLIGMDTPERGEPLWEDARDALAGMVDGEEVTLALDVSDRDRFDRLLRYVEVDGIDVGEEMVRRGFAIAREYPPDTARAAALGAAQQAAEDEGIGRWTVTTTTTAPTTTTEPATTTTAAPTTTEAPAPAGSDCHPSYEGECVPFASDVDCAGGSGNGPEYVGTVIVVGPDVYGLDGDGDGIGCE